MAAHSVFELQWVLLCCCILWVVCHVPGDAEWQAEFFGEEGEDETTETPQQSIMLPSRTLVIQFTHPTVEGWKTGLYGVGNKNLLTEKYLDMIKQFENEVMNVTGWEEYCFKPGGPTSECEPPLSVTALGYTKGIFNIKLLVQTLQSDTFRQPQTTLVPHAFGSGDRRWVRTIFRFGAPLLNFTHTKDRANEQGFLFQQWVQFTFLDHFNDVVSRYQKPPIDLRRDLALQAEEHLDTMIITWRGGLFRIYEDLWETYQDMYAVYWRDQKEDEFFGRWPGKEEKQRFALFKDNVKKLEHLGYLRVNQPAAENLNPWMHLTEQEFWIQTYANRDIKDPTPNSNVFLMWNIKPDMTDYFYPP